MQAADAEIGPASRPFGTPDERQWLEQLRRGERAALERLITEHQQRIRRLVARLTGWSDPSETDDLVQEVFVKALANIRRFKGGSRLSTWLTRIALNVCRSHRRSRMFRAAFWKRFAETGSGHHKEDASGNIQRRERIEQVTRAVGRLKPKYREIVVLHYLEEMSAEEIQTILGISRNMVEVRLHRARKMLQEILKPMIEREQ